MCVYVCLCVSVCVYLLSVILIFLAHQSFKSEDLFKRSHHQRNNGVIIVEILQEILFCPFLLMAIDLATEKRHFNGHFSSVDCQ